MHENLFNDILILDHTDDFHLSGTFWATGVTFPDHVRDRLQSSESALPNSSGVLLMIHLIPGYRVSIYPGFVFSDCPGLHCCNNHNI